MYRRAIAEERKEEKYVDYTRWYSLAEVDDREAFCQSQCCCCHLGTGHYYRWTTTGYEPGLARDFCDACIARGQRADAGTLTGDDLTKPIPFYRGTLRPNPDTARLLKDVKDALNEARAAFLADVIRPPWEIPPQNFAFDESAYNDTDFSQAELEEYVDTSDDVI